MSRKFFITLTLMSILLCAPAFAITTDTESSPGDAVIQAVDDLISATQDQQTQADLIYFQQKDDCDSDIALRQQAIAEAQDALAASQQAYGLSFAALAADNAEIDSLNGIISDLNSQLAQFAEQRAAKQAIFQQNVEEHDQLINNIDQALDILSSFQNYGDITTFVQLGAKVNSMFKNAAKVRKTNLLVPLVTSLMQIRQPSTVDADSLQKLYDLFQTLRQKTVDSKSGLVQDETDDINAYNAAVGTLNLQLDSLTARLAVVTAHQAEMQASLSQEDAITSEAQSKLDRNQNILDSTQTLCAAFVDAYTTETQNRQDHIALLQQLKQILESAISEYSYGEFASLIERFGLNAEDVERLKGTAKNNKNESGLVKQNQRKNNLRKY